MQTKFSELHKLRNAAKILENTCDSAEEKIAGLVDSSVVQLKRKIREERQKCCTSLEKQVLDILRPLKEIKQQFGDSYNVTDLERLKKDMIFLQHNISNCRFELQTRLSCLQEEETALFEDVKVYESSVAENPSHEVSKTLTKINPCNVSKDIKGSDDKKAHSEGFVWGREEHLRYLKARKTHRDFDQRCRVLMALIPGITVEDISKHETSHVLSLEEIKQDILDVEMDCKKGASGEGSSKPRKSTKHDKIIKEKLAAWKEEKKDKAIMEQHLHQLLEIKRMNEELYRRLLNEQAKEKIQQWKREKAEVAAAMENKRIEDEEREKEAKMMRANCMIKEYRKQDTEMIKKKLELKSKQTAPKPFEKVQYYAKRNPKRVHQPTEQSSARTKRSSVPNAEKLICDIHFVNKLRVPNWRKSK